MTVPHVKARSVSGTFDFAANKLAFTQRSIGVRTAILKAIEVAVEKHESHSFTADTNNFDEPGNKVRDTTDGM